MFWILLLLLLLVHVRYQVINTIICRSRVILLGHQHTVAYLSLFCLAFLSVRFLFRIMTIKNKEEELMTEKMSHSAIKDFDDILSYVGGWGPFQYILTLIFFPFNIFLGYVNLSPILTLFTPPHWCLVPELANLTWEQRRHLAIPKDGEVKNGFSQCSQFLVDWSKVCYN